VSTFSYFPKNPETFLTNYHTLKAFDLKTELMRLKNIAGGHIIAANNIRQIIESKSDSYSSPRQTISD
jgi:hypothetical protein